MTLCLLMVPGVCAIGSGNIICSCYLSRLCCIWHTLGGMFCCLFSIRTLRCVCCCLFFIRALGSVTSWLLLSFTFGFVFLFLDVVILWWKISAIFVIIAIVCRSIDLLCLTLFNAVAKLLTAMMAFSALDKTGVSHICGWNSAASTILSLHVFGR